MPFPAINENEKILLKKKYDIEKDEKVIVFAGRLSNEKGIKETLLSGDFVNIEPMVKHWVDGIIESQLILIK